MHKEPPWLFVEYKNNAQKRNRIFRLSLAATAEDLHIVIRPIKNYYMEGISYEKVF